MQTNYRSLVGLMLTLGALAASRVPAASVLLDFEKEADLRLFHYERQNPTTPVDEIARSGRFASGGEYSLRFAVPAWRPGRPEWPAFEGRPPITDWSGFDRLVFDVTNATEAPQKLFLFVSDSKTATREGLLESTGLPPFGYARVVVPLAKVTAKGLDSADIQVLHFFTERPADDMEVYLDQFLLVKPDESAPVVSRSFLGELAVLQKRRVDAMSVRLREEAAELRGVASGAPEVHAWAETVLRDMEHEVSELADRLVAPDSKILEDQPDFLRFEQRLASLEAQVGLRTEFARVRPRVKVGGTPRRDVVVGFATSMDKVLPNVAPAGLRVAESQEVHLARNETESFQVVVLPFEGGLKGVRVRVDDLEDPGGAVLAADNVESVVVGYVKTSRNPPYGAFHVGWWPDPILDFQTQADVAKGVAQAFWVRVHAPEDQPPGFYRGKLEVELDGRTTFEFALTIRVFDFGLPAPSPLPLAVTFWPMYYEPRESGGYREGEYRDTLWKKHKSQWADFLADYYLSYDSLYSYAHWAPDFEILRRLHEEGRLGRFQLGYYSACGDGAKEREAWRKRTIDVIRPRYERAKSLGLLDHAYIYGCDEHPQSLFPAVERAAKLLKAEFPDVLVLTTTYDDSYGLDSVLRSVDAFCPLTPRFDPERAARARAAGKQVWWYICCSPHSPHANMFVEYPAIEARLLMGAMTAKYRPDGFLYYQISIWNSSPVESGPFTDWDPRSWTTYHGDGSWTCLGPGGKPLATIRLENFRDGLEDYAYCRILEATVAKIEASPVLAPQRAEWLKEARSLLAVPVEVVKSRVDFTRDPKALYRYRDRLAQAIESSGVEPPRL